MLEGLTGEMLGGNGSIQHSDKFVWIIKKELMEGKASASQSKKIGRARDENFPAFINLKHFCFTFEDVKSLKLKFSHEALHNWNGIIIIKIYVFAQISTTFYAKNIRTIIW